MGIYMLLLREGVGEYYNTGTILKHFILPGDYNVRHSYTLTLNRLIFVIGDDTKLLSYSSCSIIRQKLQQECFHFS